MIKIKPNMDLDCRGLTCPLPLVQTKKAISKLGEGEILKLIATDPGSARDMDAFVRETGNTILETEENNGEFTFFIRKNGNETAATNAYSIKKGSETNELSRLDDLEKEVRELKKRVPDNKVSIILMSGDFDKAMAAFFMANGAVAMGMEVTMFFTFWGCTVIKKGKKLKGKKFLHKMINLMLPGSSKSIAPSRMSFGGIGRKLFNHMMKGEMDSLENQIEMAKNTGVTFQVCSPSLGVMGFDHDEWVVPVDICGVAAMYETALRARTQYFIS